MMIDDQNAGAIRQGRTDPVPIIDADRRCLFERCNRTPLTVEALL